MNDRPRALHVTLSLLALFGAGVFVWWRLEQDPWPKMADALRDQLGARVDHSLVVLAGELWAPEVVHFRGLPAVATSRLRTWHWAGVSEVWVVRPEGAGKEAPEGEAIGGKPFARAFAPSGSLRVGSLVAQGYASRALAASGAP